MKKMRIFAVALLTVALCLTLSFPAFASGFNAGLEVTKTDTQMTVVVQDSQVLHDKVPTLSLPATAAFEGAKLLFDGVASTVTYTDGSVSFKVAKGGTYYIVIGATPTKSTPATCEESGQNIYTFGNAEYVETIASFGGHSFTTKASANKATDATCTSAATYYVQCDNCDAVSNERSVAVGEANGHSFTTKASANKATDATCTSAATYYVQCDNCDAVSNEKTVAVGGVAEHDFRDTSKKTCANCSASNPNYKKPYVPPVNPDPVDPTPVDPEPDVPVIPEVPTVPEIPEVEDTTIDTSAPTVSTETKEDEEGNTTTTETKKDGTVVETTQKADGTTATTATKTEEKVTEEGKVTTSTTNTTITDSTGATVTEQKKESKLEAANGSVTTTVTEQVTTADAEGNTVVTSKVEEKVEVKTETGTSTTTTTTSFDSEGNIEKTVAEEETVVNEDGTTTSTTSSKTETYHANGSTGTTVEENGKVTAEVALSEKALAEAAEKGKTVVLPMPAVESKGDATVAPVINVTTAATTEAPVTVEIPVAEVSTSTVAVIVNEDGTETVVTETKMTENGLVVDVPDGATVKIVDNSTDFHDVEHDDWEKDAVDFASARGLVNGVGNNAFDLDSHATRAQVVTLLARFAGVDTTPDEGEKWYDKAHEWAVENGITYAGSMNKTITRHEIMTLLWRFMGSPESDQDLSHFTDADELNAVTTPAARWAVEIGLIQGNGNGTMTPTGPVTRGQLAQFMMNYVQKT